MNNPAATTTTILVADDEIDIVNLASRRLRRAGYEVITACNGAEALQIAQDRMPDLVLLDIMMPKLTGVEVSRLLRAAPATSAIPVILMSAALVDKQLVPEDGDAFIAKPFGPLELPALVREVLAQLPTRVT